MSDPLIRVPFDQYQRYITIKRCVEELKDAYQADRLKVLDVGGGTGIVREFLPNEDITIVDMEESDIPGYVRADGTALPFDEDMFDIVVSADVLEHVPADARQKFLAEALRVTKDVFILIAPFDHKLTPDFEKILYEFVLAATGHKHQFLKEHIDNGLPGQEIIEDFIAKSGLKAVSFPSGYIFNWLIMMMARSRFEGLANSADLIADAETTYNKNFAEGDYRAPGYRTVFIFSKKQNSKLLDRLKSGFKIETVSKENETKEMTRLCETLYGIYKTDTENKTNEFIIKLEEKDAAIALAEEKHQLEVRAVEAIVTNRDEQIANLQGWIDEIHNKRVYKLYKGARRILPGGRDK